MRTLACLLSLAAFAGCGISVHATRLRRLPPDALPIEASQVELYVDTRPPRDYVSYVRFDVNDRDATNFDIVKTLRARAADLGCDGLIVEKGAASPWALRGTCIFWR